MLKVTNDLFFEMIFLILLVRFSYRFFVPRFLRRMMSNLFGVVIRKIDSIAVEKLEKVLNVKNCVAKGGKVS